MTDNLSVNNILHGHFVGKVFQDCEWVKWDSDDPQDWMFSPEGEPINPKEYDPRNRIIDKYGRYTESDGDTCYFIGVEGIEDYVFSFCGLQKVSLTWWKE